MAFDRATFYSSVRKSVLFDGTLSQRQVMGTEAILDAWAANSWADERWLAYMLGTAYHETARAMYPVREGGQGKGHPYGKPNARGQIAYGRGYVQITWDANYEKADKALFLGGKLIADYDLALQPAIAAQILVRGMAEAWFTKFKLSDYLNDHLADYLHARRIVNGMDKAEQIAGYALVFWQAIQAGAHKADDHTSVVAAPKPALEPAMPTFGSDTKTDSSADPLGGLLGGLGSLAGTIGTVIPSSPAAGPSPGRAAPPSPATDESSIMNLLPVLAEMFGGVASKLGVATSVAQALPHVITGTISNIGEAPKAIAEINELIADIKGGKWNEVPEDLHTLMGEFTLILKNYGIDLSALTAMVPKIAESAPVPGAVAAVAGKTNVG